MKLITHIDFDRNNMAKIVHTAFFKASTIYSADKLSVFTLAKSSSFLNMSTFRFQVHELLKTRICNELTT